MAKKKKTPAQKAARTKKREKSVFTKVGKGVIGAAKVGGKLAGSGVAIKATSKKKKKPVTTTKSAAEAAAMGFIGGYSKSVSKKKKKTTSKRKKK